MAARFFAPLVVLASSVQVRAAGGDLSVAFEEDIISVPAQAPYQCEVKIIKCDDAAVLQAFGEWNAVSIRGGLSQYSCHLKRESMRESCGVDAKVLMRYNGPWAAGPKAADGSWLVQSPSGSTEEAVVVSLLPVDIRGGSWVGWKVVDREVAEKDFFFRREVASEEM
eukprot:scaffold1239_cov175-Pinguiococcus_pyrenoidosus.AAC.32